MPEMGEPMKGAEMAEKEKPETGKSADRADDIEQMKAALEKANKEAAKARHELAEREKEIKAASDSSKSEMDKVQEKLAALEERAAKAERAALIAEVANAKGLSPAQAKRLQGDSRDELERDADDLIETFGKPDKGDSNGGGEEKKPGGGGRPKEKLRPGASGGEDPADEEMDPMKLADLVPRR